MLQGRTITLNFDDEDVTTILEDDRGNPLELDDFKEDDVVAVVSDNENFKNYLDYIRIIKLRNAVVRGSVDSAFTSNGNRYVVIDDEEFTAYLYPTEAHLWEILDDPTGMAYNTIYGNGKGKMSEQEHNEIIAQVSDALNK